MIDALEEIPDKYVSYELKIRGKRLTGTNLKSRKRALEAIYRDEMDNSNYMDMIFHMSLEDDLKQCAEYLEEILLRLHMRFEEFAVSAENQLMFLRERVERLPTSRGEHNDALRMSILTRIEETEARFGDVTVSINPNATAQNLASRDVTRSLYAQLSNLNSFFNSQHSSTRHQNVANLEVENMSRPISTVARSTNSVSFVPTNTAITHEHSNTSLLAQIQTPNVSIEGESPVNTPNSNTTHTVSNHSNVSPVYNNQVQVWKWQVKFNGEKDNLSATEFIQKIVDFANSRGVAEVQLLNSMPDLLDGAALKWYRSAIKSNPFGSFENFVKRFIDDFDPQYRVDTRLEMLRKRLQRTDERVVNYFAHMEHEFSMISNAPNIQEQIRIIRKNLLPHFITHLACQSFTTVEELKCACKKIEVSQDVIRCQNVVRGQQSNAFYSGCNSNWPSQNGNFQNQANNQQFNQNRNNNFAGFNQNRYNQQSIPFVQQQNELQTNNSNQNRQNANFSISSTPNKNGAPAQAMNTSLQNNSPQVQTAAQITTPSPQITPANQQTYPRSPNQNQNQNYTQYRNQFTNQNQPSNQNKNPFFNQNNSTPGQNRQYSQRYPQSDGSSPQQNNFQQRNSNNNRLSNGFQSFKENLNVATDQNHSPIQPSTSSQMVDPNNNSHVASISSLVMPFIPDLTEVESQVNQLLEMSTESEDLNSSPELGATGLYSIPENPYESQ